MATKIGRINELDNVVNVKVNLTATTAPLPTDDSSYGYIIGSRWINVNTNKEYVCVDSSIGSAIWTETTMSAGSGDVVKVATPVNNQVGIWTGDGTLEGDTNLTFDGLNLSVGGNISVGGTVDGIDIATDVAANTSKNSYPSADSTKLAGIESNATEDQTASEVPIVDSGGLITATEVEGAFAENRTAINLNTAKATNVPTSLSEGTRTPTTYGITSDGGADDLVLPEANTTNGGILGADKWDEIVANTAHKSSDGSDHSFIDQDVTSGSSPTFDGGNIASIVASNVEFLKIGTPTYDDAQDWMNIIQSASVISGFTLSNSRASAELDVASGEGLIKITDSGIGVTKPFSYVGINNLTLTDNTTNYIYIDYNAGAPIAAATITRSSIEINRHFVIGRCYKNGATLTILNAAVLASNLARTEHERLVDVYGFQHASGAQVAESGTLKLQVTAGKWYMGHNPVLTDALDTNVADTFIYTHYGISSWITDNAVATTIDYAKYSNGTDTLVNLTSNRYGVHWVYILQDSSLYVLYGLGDYSLTQADDASPPTNIPNIIGGMGELLAKIIVKQDGTLISIESAFALALSLSGTIVHNESSGLDGGTTNQYYHLSLAQHTIAIQAASTSLSGYLSAANWNIFNNKAAIASPTFTGTVTLPTTQLGETSIKLDDALSGDETWSGITIQGILGQTVVSGDLCRFDTSTGKWRLADADISPDYNRMLSICLNGGNLDDAREFLVYGKTRSANYPTFSKGSPIYMGSGAGIVTHTAPTTDGSAIRVIGYGLTIEEMIFSPSNDYIVVGEDTDKQPFVIDSFHTAWGDGLSNEEIYRLDLEPGEILKINKVEMQLKGGGTQANHSVDIYDLTNTTVIASTTAGSVNTTAGSSGAGAVVLIRVTNSVGSDQISSIGIRGYIT